MSMFMLQLYAIAFAPAGPEKTTTMRFAYPSFSPQRNLWPTALYVIAPAMTYPLRSSPQLEVEIAAGDNATKRVRPHRRTPAFLRGWFGPTLGRLLAQGPAQVLADVRVRLGRRPHLQRRPVLQLACFFDALQGPGTQELLGQAIRPRRDQRQPLGKLLRPRQEGVGGD